MRRVHPVDTGEGLRNPQMGWVLHYYDNSLHEYGGKLTADDVLDDFPGLETIYFRLPWSDLEPEEGVFRWDLIDTPAARFLERGWKLAFRFTCAEGHGGTPEWVYEVGARRVRYTPGSGEDEHGERWEPDYEDLIFLEKLESFLRAAARRYDGDPRVAWIDVGSFGIWGEGHTFWSSKRRYSAETLITHIDLHQRCFPRTLLVCNDDFADHGRGEASLEHSARHGLTIRDDSIVVSHPTEPWRSPERVQPFWPNVPVIVENEHYWAVEEFGAWGDGEKFVEAMRVYRGSYASIHTWPREFLADHRPLIERMNRVMGYRLVVESADLPDRIEPGAEVRVRLANRGVAPCYPGGFGCLTVKNGDGFPVAVTVNDSQDVRELPTTRDGTGEAVELTFRIPPFIPATGATGELSLWFSVGRLTAEPTLALPHTPADPSRRMRLG